MGAETVSLTILAAECDDQQLAREALSLPGDILVLAAVRTLARSPAMDFARTEQHAAMAQNSVQAFPANRVGIESALQAGYFTVSLPMKVQV